VLGVLFHKFSKHSYPHRPSIASINTHKTTDAAPAVRVWFTTEDIDSAIADLHETLDISRGDIDALLRRVEQRALNRAHGELKCRDIMSKDVVFVGSGASAEEVSALLRYHHLKTLPVVGEDGRLVGTVSYPELAHVNSNEPLRVSKASTARPDDIAIGLLPVLTDGQTHNVIIVSEDNHIVGIVSQTDLLVALGKNLLWHLPKKK
jgi:CBS domain-containing membrane protein